MKYIASPTDTPELNGIAEEVNGWFGKVVTTMLHHSGRPVSFWNKAYSYAVQIKFVVPFNTAQGVMSSFEFLLGVPPDYGWFRTWGCKAFVLEPRSEHRKDFHPKSVMGFFYYVVDQSNWVGGVGARASRNSCIGECRI